MASAVSSKVTPSLARVDVLDEVVDQRVGLARAGRPREEVDLVTADREGDLEAGHSADAIAPGAGGVDHDGRLDLAPIGVDARHPTARERKAHDFGLLEDRRPALARGRREALRGLRRVGVAGLGLVATDHEVVDAEAGLDLAHLGRRDQPRIDAHRLLERDGFFHRHAQPVVDAQEIAHAGERRGAPGCVLGEVFEETQGVEHHAARLRGAVVLPDAGRALAGRAGGQEVLLDDRDVAHAAAGEVIGDAAAGHAAADDDDVSRSSHGASRSMPGQPWPPTRVPV